MLGPEQLINKAEKTIGKVVFKTHLTAQALGLFMRCILSK